MHIAFLRVFGAFEIVLGVGLMVLMIFSFFDAELVLTLFGLPATSLAANGWAQTAVAFGMHAYADIANGLELISTTHRSTLPPTVTVWNKTRFIVSFLWMLSIVKAMVAKGGYNVIEWPSLPLVLLIALLLDSLILRPIAVYCQRILNDSNPPLALVEAKEWQNFSLTQKFCRCVFYYEAVISGTSGMVYYCFPELFMHLYFPHIKTPDAVALWSLSQFGVLVMAFGLYQMDANIDTRTGHVVWWLVLDIVWMYVFWQGVGAELGPWNPLTLSGANFWCHVAFHADSSLAVARVMFLLTLGYKGRGRGGGVKKQSRATASVIESVTAESDVAAADIAATPAAGTRARRARKAD
jgi:hypothetical protein